MNTQDPNATIAVYLDLENIALGALDAHYPTFSIQKVLERLLLKGHIVVKKAYCDFDRLPAWRNTEPARPATRDLLRLLQRQTEEAPINQMRN